MVKFQTTVFYSRASGCRYSLLKRVVIAFPLIPLSLTVYLFNQCIQIRNTIVIYVTRNIFVLPEITNKIGTYSESRGVS